ncbi:hypothetical protein LCGC14_1816770 [marine sediment metagenome]|uniref:DUF5405 domain-containing protein n=1 Tax=marine sediment metagenome TaxID=412755 RepID=A0A0F9GK54_9ZZZZ
MNIGKGWKIEADPLNIILSKRHTVRAKDGKPAHTIWKVVGYYSTIKAALVGLVNQGVSDTELTDLATISQKQDELYKLIDRRQSNERNKV